MEPIRFITVQSISNRTHKSFIQKEESLPNWTSSVKVFTTWYISGIQIPSHNSPEQVILQMMQTVSQMKNTYDSLWYVYHNLTQTIMYRNKKITYLAFFFLRFVAIPMPLPDFQQIYIYIFFYGWTSSKRHGIQTSPI